MNLFTFLRYDGIEMSVPFKNIDAIAAGVRDTSHGMVYTTGGNEFQSKESYAVLVERYNGAKAWSN